MPEAYRKTEAEADIATMGWAEECVPDIWHKRHYITLTGILEVGVVNLAPLEPVSCSLGLTCLQSNLTSGHAPPHQAGNAAVHSPMHAGSMPKVVLAPPASNC